MTDSTRQKTVVLRAAIWGIAGAFFGIVFLSALLLLDNGGTALWHIPLAGAVAGSIVAAFYSVKRVGVAGGMAGSLSALGALIMSPSFPTVWQMIGITGGIGFATGLAASRAYERRRGALPVALAGAAVGLLIGGLCAAIALAWPTLAEAGPLTLVMAPTIGVLFSILTGRYGRDVGSLVPHWLGIALVCAGVAGMVGTGFWIMSMSLQPEVDAVARDAVREMMVDLPDAMLGGALGCAVAGAVLEIANFRWLNRF